MIFLVRKPVTLSLDTEIVAAVDARSGWDSRSRTVERMLLRVLGPNLDADLGPVVSVRGRGRPRKVSSDLADRIMAPSPGAVRRESEALGDDPPLEVSGGVRGPEDGSGEPWMGPGTVPEFGERLDQASGDDLGVPGETSPLVASPGPDRASETLRKESAVDRNIRLAEARQALLKAQRDS